MPLTLQLPDPAEINSPGTVTVHVQGGEPPYTVTCPPPPQGVKVVALGGGGHNFEVRAPAGLASGSTVLVVVSDSAGDQDNGTLTVS